ncbi:M56 family metallopeptidase [Paenibacillus macerans]|nr:M56 family metallopeptidase [Paenibacillus macerans]
MLKHELIHFKRKDLWYKSLVFVAAAMHWFNPAVYLMAKSIAKQCEISCDAEVVRGADYAARQQYSETILRVIRNQSKLQTMFSSNFYGGLKEMKQRIIGIMDIAKKKNGIVVLGLILLGTIGSGIAFPANQEAAAGAYAEEAVASAREQADTANWLDSEETSQSYAVYKKYGLTFDEKKNRFYYYGKLVRSFADELDGNGTYRFFTFPDGVINLEAVRNADNELIGLSPVSREKYDEAFSSGDPDDEEDSMLSPYLEYGVSYDEANGQWKFGNKPIHYLSDGNYLTYVNNSAYAIKNGLSLEAIRNADGQIEKLVEISEGNLY